jgi:hypothetical protein
MREFWLERVVANSVAALEAIAQTLQFCFVSHLSPLGAGFLFFVPCREPLATS